ncbi:9237_t:CDS:1, partial [Entrophospora sp. SA101]
QTYSSVESANNNDKNGSLCKALKPRHLDFEEKFTSSNSDKKDYGLC